MALRSLVNVGLAATPGLSLLLSPPQGPPDPTSWRHNHCLVLGGALPWPFLKSKPWGICVMSLQKEGCWYTACAWHMFVERRIKVYIGISFSKLFWSFQNGKILFCILSDLMNLMNNISPFQIMINSSYSNGNQKTFPFKAWSINWTIFYIHFFKHLY